MGGGVPTTVVEGAGAAPVMMIVCFSRTVSGGTVGGDGGSGELSVNPLTGSHISRVIVGVPGAFSVCWKVHVAAAAADMRACQTSTAAPAVAVI
jgi:hypothetical protein